MNFMKHFHYVLSSQCYWAVLTERNRKKTFQDFVLHAKHGIPVYVVKNQYLLLWTMKLTFTSFIEDIVNDNKEMETANPTLSPDVIIDILDSPDTSWDKKVLKVVINWQQSF